MYNKTAQLKHKRLRHALSAPFILGMIVPLIFLDLCFEIYHRIAFLLYGLEVNRRGNYIRIDRQKLSYLSRIDKIWCMYCGYANGLLAYTVKIAGDTEKYWCGIKHKPGRDFVEPKHHSNFLEYGDKKAYEELVGAKKNSQHLVH